jgi:hypothetical protein
MSNTYSAVMTENANGRVMAQQVDDNLTYVRMGDVQAFVHGRPMDVFLAVTDKRTDEDTLYTKWPLTPLGDGRTNTTDLRVHIVALQRGDRQTANWPAMAKQYPTDYSWM